MNKVYRVYVEKRSEYAVDAKKLFHNIKSQLKINELENIKVIKEYCESVGWDILDEMDWIDITKDINNDGSVNQVDNILVSGIVAGTYSHTIYFPLTNYILYVKQGTEYVLATDVFNYPDRYSFWTTVQEPDYYYIKTENNIDLQYSKTMKFEQLGEVTSFGVSNGIICEQTFQLQMMDYYTEVNDLATAKAKKAYQDAFNFLKNVFKMFGNIEQADMKRYKYNTLYEIYTHHQKGRN